MARPEKVWHTEFKDSVIDSKIEIEHLENNKKELIKNPSAV